MPTISTCGNHAASKYMANTHTHSGNCDTCATEIRNAIYVDRYRKKRRRSNLQKKKIKSCASNSLLAKKAYNYKSALLPLLQCISDKTLSILLGTCVTETAHRPEQGKQRGEAKQRHCAGSLRGTNLYNSLSYM